MADEETRSEQIEKEVQGAGGDTNDPDVTSTSNQDKTDDLSGLPDDVADDIRSAAGGAGEGSGPTTP